MKVDSIIDLTMPIEDHFRWKIDRKLVQSFANGDQFQVTWVGWSMHSFTHIDSPRHIDAAGNTSCEFELQSTTGEACVIDLTDLEANEAITAERLAVAAQSLRSGDIAVLKSCWEDKTPMTSDGFWKTAPYLTREACEWLLAKEIKSLAMDFPQDEPIRYLLDGEVRPMHEFVSHEVLLANGVPLIEYICNLRSVVDERVLLFALPIKLPESDGCPARVIAIPLK